MENFLRYKEYWQEVESGISAVANDVDYSNEVKKEYECRKNNEGKKSQAHFAETSEPLLLSMRQTELFHDLDDFEQVMCVNVKGVTLGIKHTTTPMKIPRATGCIITTTSVAGVSGGMGPHAYTTSKHAIVGLTKNTACELGRYGIRVNCISPFRVATTMLVNAWRDDENECMNFGIPSPAEVDQMEEFVTGLTNLKDPTMRCEREVEGDLRLPDLEGRDDKKTKTEGLRKREKIEEANCECQVRKKKSIEL
ncbi:short-chain dehydrogenase reductase 2a-like [Cucurbita pepo subsp. pepo]|uniref:short-chain dehydrogenase reductase 2a-like n=1 Tax=Cucurbita pepo subsp. pepo TaxID=3664 RepID=UPI000C9D8F16|nr:short-chain dehydrogenase reductase 2a-like [Cucurbita pepo subsp. pepo]